MRTALVSVFRGILLYCLTATLAIVPLNGQQPAKTRPAQGGQQGRPNPGGGNNRPQRPNPGNGNGNNRPQPQRPNPGVGNNRPQRPNPGNGNGGRPPRPNPGQGSKPGQRPPSHRPPQWGKPPQKRPSYQFRPNDRDYLRRYYLRNLGYINRARRPVFSIGGYFPYGDIGYLTPLPPHLYGYLPPPPLGYQMGYFDGYVVVYDPLTYFIANVVDLM